MCVDNLTINGPDNGLLPGRHQAIIWSHAGILSFEPLRTNFSEILIEIHIFLLKKNAFGNVVWKTARAAILSREDELTSITCVQLGLSCIQMIY